MAKKKELTDKQKKFAEEYLVDTDGSKAAKRAGYADASARQQASQMLNNNPLIQEEIQKKMDERSIRTQITSDKVLENIWNMADVDIGDAYDENGRLLNIKDMPVHVRKAISSIKIFEEFEGFGQDRLKVGEVREVKFWDKVKTNELLGKHLKLFADKLEIEDVTKGKAERLAAARKRASKKDE